MLRHIKELYHYRELVKHLVALDLKVRYRGSVLGFLWTLLNPILLTLVLWFVFSKFGRINEKNYALFLLSGMMIWLFFQQSVANCLNSVIKQRGLIQQIYVPKIVFPFSDVTSNLVNFAFFLAAYFIIAVFTDVGIVVTAPLIIPAAIMQYMLTAGAGLIMSALNVFFRDFTHLTTVILRALFYLTPIIYPPDMLGPKGALLLRFNPVFYPVVAAREAIYYGRMPSLDIWVIGFSIATVVMFTGVAMFGRLQNKFVYYA